MEHLGTCKGREEEVLNAELAKVAEEKRQAEAGGPLARTFYCSKWGSDSFQLFSILSQNSGAIPTCG